MHYILGSQGIISNNIKKILNSKCLTVSRKVKSNCLTTKIFSKNFNKIDDDFLKNVNNNDTVIILSNLGGIYQYEHKKKFTFFLNCLKKNLLSNLPKSIKIIFFSSDYVFSGRNKTYFDHSKASPINRYGMSKVIIERYIRKNFINYLILRVPKIYSLNLKDNSFISDFFNSKKKKISILHDQNSHLMNIEDLKIILKKIFFYKNLRGSFNLPSYYYGSRYSFLLDFIKYNNLKKIVEKISINDLKIKIPKNLRMSTSLYKKINYKHKENILKFF